MCYIQAMNRNKHLIQKLCRGLALCGLAAVCACVGCALFAEGEQQTASAYSPYCTTQRCREAADKAAEAANKAAEATQAANSLQGELDSLSAQIAELEAEIAANEAMISDLEIKIFETQTELERQQAALAQLLIAQYHSQDGATSSAIDVLATSNSISDLADEATRQTSAEEQINKTARTVNATKLDLEQQRASVQATLQENEQKNEKIADIYAKQKSLQDAYLNDAAGYNAYAAEQQAIVAAETQKQADAAAANDSSGVSSSGATGWWGKNTYPYAGRCPSSNLAFSAYGGYVCQCTSYAGWKAREKYGTIIQSWGNAYAWADTAQIKGYTVSSTPAAGTIAQSSAGQWGHVAWVESVNADGTINITEYNRSDGTCRAGDFCARVGVNPHAYVYIYPY